MRKSKWSRSQTTYAGLGLLVAGLVGWDLYIIRYTFFVGAAESQQESAEPLQVEGLPSCARHPPWERATRRWPWPPPPTAATATGPAGRGAQLRSVDALVRRALDLDQSEKSIRKVIAKTGCCSRSISSPTAALNSAYYTDGFEHPGQVTDQRVVKSVINYLIEKWGMPHLHRRGWGESCRGDRVSTNATEELCLRLQSLIFRGFKTVTGICGPHYALSPRPRAIQRLVRVLDYQRFAF